MNTIFTYFNTIAITISFIVIGIVYRKLKNNFIEYNDTLISLNQKHKSKVDEINLAYTKSEQVVCELRKQIKELETRLEQTVQRDSSLSSYNHAAKMLQMGADIDEVIAACGLTKAEAKLLSQVNKPKSIINS